MAVKLDFFVPGPKDAPDGSNMYRAGQPDERRIVCTVEKMSFPIDHVEWLVAKFEDDEQWYCIPTEPEHDEAFDPQGPFPNPESALVALRLQADTKDEE